MASPPLVLSNILFLVIWPQRLAHLMIDRRGVPPVIREPGRAARTRPVLINVGRSSSSASQLYLKTCSFRAANIFVAAARISLRSSHRRVDSSSISAAGPLVNELASYY